jgi:putative salt-induced outer membrane protein
MTGSLLLMLLAAAPQVDVVVFAAPPPLAPPLITPPAPPSVPPKLPDEVQAVIDAAIEAGDPQAISAVMRFTKQTNPASVSQIDALNAAYQAKLAEKQAREARERAERLAAASFLELWKGEIEAGASRSTGNTDNLGLYGGVKLEREGLKWRNRVNARADFQRTSDVTTTERVSASWQPNYKFDDRLYAYGIAQYEHDRFLGYSNRYTSGGGIGYGVVTTPALKIDFEGGPAFRYTEMIDGESETAIASRASLGLRWKISPTLQFTQDAALYIESGNNNAVATSALDTRLIGALKARFSYNVQYEKDAPVGRDPVDTLSRATLVYSF